MHLGRCGNETVRNVWKMKKKVTVVVPVYNSEKTLERCISSLCKQDYSELEILLIDNNSTDNSKFICEQYSLQDSRIRVLEEKKRGASAARNKGILEGTGDILCFVDSDDELMCDTAITEIASVMNSGEMVLFDYVDFEPERKRGRASFFWNNDSLTAINMLEQVEECDFVELIFVAVWNKAFCFDTIRKNKLFFEEDRVYWEDFSFVLQYMTKIAKVRFIHKIFYKKWEDHLTTAEKMGYDFLQMVQNGMNDIAKFLKPFKIYEKAYINLARFISSIAVMSVVRIHHPNAKSSRIHCKEEIAQLLHNNAFREAFNYYRPRKGQSKALPFCMKRGMVNLVYVMGKHRAKKVYE